MVRKLCVVLRVQAATVMGNAVPGSLLYHSAMRLNWMRRAGELRLAYPGRCALTSSPSIASAWWDSSGSARSPPTPSARQLRGVLVRCRRASCDRLSPTHVTSLVQSRATAFTNTRADYLQVILVACSFPPTTSFASKLPTAAVRSSRLSLLACSSAPGVLPQSY